MLKKLTLSALFYCGFLSAADFGHDDMERLLTQSVVFFENVSLSELNFPYDEESNEYYFSFCLLENQHWGIAPYGKPIGYWMNPDNQQPEQVHCQQTISLQEFDDLFQYIRAAEAKKSLWSIGELLLCYSKRSGNTSTGICHPAPHDNSIYGLGSINNWVYRYGAKAFAVALALTTVVTAALFVLVSYEYTKMRPTPHLVKPSRRVRKRAVLISQ